MPIYVIHFSIILEICIQLVKIPMWFFTFQNSDFIIYFQELYHMEAINQRWCLRFQMTINFLKTAFLRYNWHKMNYFKCRILYICIYIHETITTIKIMSISKVPLCLFVIIVSHSNHSPDNNWSAFCCYTLVYIT